ncbi:MAG: hypothetical protein C0404_13180, partial [Verrucomicrobia bacterium]|nr:hypothetical protein [Verrucomicrobiota bacterium]
MSEQTLTTICSQFRNRLRKMLMEYGVLQTVLLTLMVAAGMVLADWYFRFSPDMRMLSLVAVLAVLGTGILFGLYRPLKRAWSDREMLEYMDRAMEKGDDMMTTLSDLSHPEKMKEWETEQGKQIVRTIVSDLEARARNADVGKVLRLRPISLWRKVAVAVLALYVAGFIFPRDKLTDSAYLTIGLKRMILPYGSIFWPQKTRLLVQATEAGWRVPRGEPLAIRVKVEGEVPPIVNISYRSSGSDQEITERMAVNAVGAEATFTFGEMTEPMTFYCTGGDDLERRRYSVTLAERPMITGIKAAYTYPKYMRLPNRELKSGQLSGPEGAEVKLDFTVSTALKKVLITLRFDGDETNQPPVEITEFKGTAFAHGMRLARNGSYSVELTDKEGLKNGKVEKFDIKVEPDNPPEVTLEEPLRDMLMTANGRLRIKFRAKDDYNLTDVNVMLSPAGANGMPLSDKITGPVFVGTTTLHPDSACEFDLDFPRENEKGTIKNLKLQNGAELELWVRAVDCNPSGNGVSESSKVRLSILTETDFMDAVVLKAKELMNDAQLGWYSAAGAYHDGAAWVKTATDDEMLNNILLQQQALERAAAAAKLHYEEVVQHMQRNRLQHVFMSKRMDKVGSMINEIGTFVPQIAAKIAAGRPGSSQEEEPASRRAKMARALQTTLQDQNKAAWQMKLLYDRLADWVSLQSVLLKTRRIEEMQTKVNSST